MTWALGPTTGVVEAIDSDGKPFNVGPPPMMERGQIVTDDDAEQEWQRHVDPVPVRQYESPSPVFEGMRWAVIGLLALIGLIAGVAAVWP